MVGFTVFQLTLITTFKDENGDISFGFVRIIMEDRVGSHLMEKIVRVCNLFGIPF